MNLSDVTKTKSPRKSKNRVGRGPSSGAGKTSNRGTSGFYSGTGNRMNATLEGGQMPLFRRLPRRGFNNKNYETLFTPVNLRTLETGFTDGDEVSYESLKSRGLVDKRRDGIKILGTGELTKKLTVRAAAISKSARDKVEKAGGSVILTGEADQSASEPKDDAKPESGE